MKKLKIRKNLRTRKGRDDKARMIRCVKEMGKKNAETGSAFLHPEARVTDCARETVA